MEPAPAEGRVVGIGLASMDALLVWQDMSKPVADNRVRSFQLQGGGMVGSALVAVTRLGGRAEFWGAVGDDLMGELTIRELRDENVDVSHVVRVAGASGPLVVVCVDKPTGERRFLHWTGACAREEPIVSPEALAGAGCLLVDGCQLSSALVAAEEAGRLGIPVVSDVGRITDGNRPLIERVNYAIVSEMCARRVDTGGDLRKACEAIRAMGPSCVVVTLGDKGLLAFDDDGFVEMDAFDVDVADTTGAGDVFHGAFCFGLLRGLTVRENLVFSSAVAAMKCRRVGGRAGIPTCAEVRQFLAARGVGLARELT